MAAPSQTSPHHASEKTTASSKPDEEGPVVAPSAAPKRPPAAAAAAAPQELTYKGTEASDAFLLAKNLLSDGDFDNAMETIGTAMGSVMSQLPEDQADVHEALAPLYYLYGTTLLYSIEESTDAALQATDGQGEDEADDSQIAWENLEAARHIIDKMLCTSDNGDCDDDDDDDDNEMKNKLSLDLAQIHLRLGDLQRANGRYSDAITDYSKCLELRQPILGVYDRKVADTHYNLGLVYMLLASEGDKQQQQQQPQQETVSGGGDPPASLQQQQQQPEEQLISPQLREEYRNKALTHYYAGGKSFAGQIAFLCGVSPEEITAEATVPHESTGKTTGMDEAELQRHASTANISYSLGVIRARVAPMEGGEDVHDLKEILDEIQETIDEAETAKKAIEEVSELKAQAQAAAEADGEVKNADGSTTTIGFGAAAAPPATAAGATVMVVRKKKKPREEEDSKMPPDNAKRAKTE